jgi:hypothetical protein
MRGKKINEYILDEHLLRLMVELMAEEWRRLEWNIMVVDINDFDEVILIKVGIKIFFILNKIL